MPRRGGAMARVRRRQAAQKVEEEAALTATKAKTKTNDEAAMLEQLMAEVEHQDDDPANDPDMVAYTTGPCPAKGDFVQFVTGHGPASGFVVGTDENDKGQTVYMVKLNGSRSIYRLGSWRFNNRDPKKRPRIIDHVKDLKTDDIYRIRLATKSCLGTADGRHTFAFTTEGKKWEVASQRKEVVRYRKKQSAYRTGHVLCYGI